MEMIGREVQSVMLSLAARFCPLLCDISAKPQSFPSYARSPMMSPTCGKADALDERCEVGSELVGIYDETRPQQDKPIAYDGNADSTDSFKWIPDLTDTNCSLSSFVRGEDLAKSYREKLWKIS